MSCAPPPAAPTLAGLRTFFYANTQIPTSVIPADSEYFSWAFDVAVALVNRKLRTTGLYALAVYNLATDSLINWAPPSSDPAVPFPADNAGNLEYIVYLRQQYGSSQFTPGVIATAGDESTTAGYTPLDQYQNYTLANLQNLKTPWGRQYLALAANVGPTLQGIS